VTEMANVLREHRRALVEGQAPGVSDGWVFPSEVGTLRTPGSLWKPWQGYIEAIGLTQRFTVHGLRRTFNDLARRAGADRIVIRCLTGHVTEKMREHYSTSPWTRSARRRPTSSNSWALRRSRRHRRAAERARSNLEID
jgi:integrase